MNSTTAIIAFCVGIAVGVAAVSGFPFQKKGVPYEVIANSGGVLRVERATGKVWILKDYKTGWIAVSTNMVENP